MYCFISTDRVSVSKCALPTKGDLKKVIEEIFKAPITTVDVMNFHLVCLAFDDVQDRYRGVSVLVEYTCSGHGNCPSGTAVEQIESECDNGVWSNTVHGFTVTVSNRSQTTKASWETSTQKNCSFCLSPKLESHRYVIDPVTHCVGEYVDITSTSQAVAYYCYAFPQGVLNLATKVSCNALNYWLTVAVATTITLYVWMNAPVLSSPTLPMSVYVQLELLDTTVLSVSQYSMSILSSMSYDSYSILSLPDVDCGSLDDPENGTVSVPDTTYNSSANYSCDPGYGLIGDAMRTCLGTGSWSGSEPTCTSKYYDTQSVGVYHVKFSVGH